MSLKERKNKKVSILGYGSQGRAIAMNLKDSGYDVTIGLPQDSKTRRKARADGFKPVVTSETTRNKLIIFALPDHLQGRIYKREIEPNLTSGCCLVFLHGFAIHFNYIQPPSDCDVIMIAPHAPGKAVREKYLDKTSISAFYAIEQDYSKKAEKTAVELARAIGIKKNLMIKTTFRDEALGDLFGEQAVLCGGLSELILSGFETLTKNGLPPENAYLEVAYQLDLIVQLIKQHGIEGMYQRISTAAMYGSLNAGSKIIDSSVKKRMSLLFKEIESGKFASKLNKLTEKDISSLNKKLHKKTNKAFEKAAGKFSK